MKRHMEGKIDLKTTTYEIIEVPEISPERIRAIRKHMGMMQEVFGKLKKQVCSEVAVWVYLPENNWFIWRRQQT